jgi:subtilisin family serine protease
MSRILKVFVTGGEQEALADRARIVERYPGFVVVETPDEASEELARSYPAQDITDQYLIPANQPIDTDRPRLDARGTTRAHPAYEGTTDLPRGRHHYLVQFVGPIKEEWLEELRGLDTEPREPYSGFTYVVRADRRGIERVAARPYVRWVGHLPHRDRIAPALYQAIEQEAPAGAEVLPRTRLLADTYTVEFFGPDDAAQAAAKVRRLGFEVLAEEPGARVLVVRPRSSRGDGRRKIEALSAVHGVRQIRERAMNRPSNDVAATIMGTAQAMGANPGLDLSGRGETVAVCDTGLDTGDPASVHADFRGRVAAVLSYPIGPDLDPFVNNPGGDDGPADLDSGHGTHVAGSVLGNGAASVGIPGLASPIRGLAYNARLVFQAVEQELRWKNPADLQRHGRYVLAGIPVDLTRLFDDAYRRRARIHSNSWGGGAPGEYDEQCQALDRFVWDHKDFCVVVSAGNDGTDQDGDGRINPMSVTSPGTAKNCITVGACENDRPNFAGETYGAWWPRDYPVAPFKTDPMANDPSQVVAFSSRGPTLDQRFKPDVVAPGTFILSTRSVMIAMNNTAWAAYPPSRLYFHMGGTSMATPLTSGAVVLLREYLRRRQRIARPTAALLKAALVAGAVRLPGGQGEGAVVDNDQGFGRVNLDGVVAPPPPAVARFLQVRPGLGTGDVRTLDLTVASAAVPLRIVLAYSDFPGPALVNDLNLLVTAPDGRRLAGNQPAGGALALDAHNNVEVVHVDDPAPGVWQVQVVGSNVPFRPQPYALVTIGHLG